MPFSIPLFLATRLDSTPLRSPVLLDNTKNLLAERRQLASQPLECLSTVAPMRDAVRFSGLSFVSEQLIKETSAQVAAGFVTGMMAASRYCEMARKLVDKKLPLTAEMVKQKGLSNALTSFIVPLYDAMLESLRDRRTPGAGAWAALGAAVAETALTIRAERRALRSLTGNSLPLLGLFIGLTARAGPSWYISGESRAYAQNQQLEAISASAVGIGAGLMTALATTPLQNFLFAQAFQGDMRKALQFFSQKPSRAFSGMHHRAFAFAYFIIGMMAADAVSRPSLSV